MIEFVLGLIVGLINAGLLFLFTLKQRTPIDRVINRINSKLAPKGSIIDNSEREELEEWVDSLKHETV